MAVAFTLSMVLAVLVQLLDSPPFTFASDTVRLLGLVNSFEDLFIDFEVIFRSLVTRRVPQNLDDHRDSRTSVRSP